MENTKLYIIHKFNQAPDNEKGSYSGAIWEKANARHKFQAFYTNKSEASLIAFYLNEYASHDEDFMVSEKDAEVEFIEATEEDLEYINGE